MVRPGRRQCHRRCAELGGGITPFLKICSLADHKGLRMAPRFLTRRIFLIGSGIAFEHEPMGTL
jgi:hypothetical protein